MDELMDVVNERDEVIGEATRKEVYQKSLRHRIVHVLVFNGRGEMLLQKRAAYLPFCPGCWSTSVGGHVRSGETYEQAAMREYREELCATSRIEFFSKDLYVAPGSPPKFVVAFKAVSDGPFSAGEDVESVGFFPLERIRAMVEEGQKFHPELLFLLKKYFLGG